MAPPARRSSGPGLISMRRFGPFTSVNSSNTYRNIGTLRRSQSLLFEHLKYSYNKWRYTVKNTLKHTLMITASVAALVAASGLASAQGMNRDQSAAAAP